MLKKQNCITRDKAYHRLLIRPDVRVQLKLVSVAGFNLSVYFWIKRLKNCTQIHC